jgi:hypothetical protein
MQVLIPRTMPARQCQPFSGTPLGYRVLGLLVCFQSTAHEPSSSSTFRSPSRHANRRSCLEHVLDFAASTALHCLGGTYVLTCAGVHVLHKARRPCRVCRRCVPRPSKHRVVPSARIRLVRCLKARQGLRVSFWDTCKE